MAVLPRFARWCNGRDDSSSASGASSNHGHSACRAGVSAGRIFEAVFNRLESPDHFTELHKLVATAQITSAMSSPLSAV